MQQPFQNAGDRSAGFTLIEAMVTVTVMVILATIAAPSYTRYVADKRIDANAYALHSAILMARSEAIKRNGTVSLEAKDESWNNGWVLYAAINPTSYILDNNGSENLSISNDKDATRIDFTSDGRPSIDTIFTVAMTSGSGNDPMCVSITLSGLAKVQKGNSGACP